MDFKLRFGFLAALAAFMFALAVPGANAAADKSGGASQWQKQAEQQFFLQSGFADKLMSQKDWQTHSDKMAKMNTGEKLAFRKEMHQKYMQEARSQGLPLPDMPEGHGHKGGAKGTTST